MNTSRKRKYSDTEKKVQKTTTIYGKHPKRRRSELSMEEKDALHFQPIDNFERTISDAEIVSWHQFMYPQMQPLTYDDHTFYSQISIQDIPTTSSNGYQESFQEIMNWTNMHLKKLGWKSNQTKYYPVCLSNGINELRAATVVVLKLAYKQRQIVDQHRAKTTF